MSSLIVLRMAQVQVLMLLPCVMMPAGAQPQQHRDIEIPEGTAVTLLLKQAIGSKHVFPGQRVEFAVVSDVVLDGQVVIAKGSPAWGSVTAGSHGGRRFDVGGELIVEIEWAQDVTGEAVELSWQGSVRERSRQCADLDCLAYLALLPVLKGEQASLPKGAKFVARTVGNQYIDAGLVQKGNAATLAHQESLTLATVTLYRVQRGLAGHERMSGVEYPPVDRGNCILQIIGRCVESRQVVYLNDNKLAAFPPNRSLTLDLPAGDYKFGSDCPGTRNADCRSSVELTLQPGEARYLRVGKSGRKNHGLEVVNSQTGEEESSWLDSLDSKDLLTQGRKSAVR